MNAPYRSPAITLETDRQWLRRLISSFRHDRLDMRAEVRAEIASDNARPVLVDDDWFERDEHLRKGRIAADIYHGGEMP
jgi:hypothetical protein